MHVQCSKNKGALGARHAHFRDQVHVFRMCVPDGRTFLRSILIEYTRGVHRKIPRRTVSICVHPRGAQNKTLISNTDVHVSYLFIIRSNLRVPDALCFIKKRGGKSYCSVIPSPQGIPFSNFRSLFFLVLILWTLTI